MAAIILLFCIISFLSGLYSLTTAKTILQQIIGGMSFVSASILLSGAVIVDAINKIERYMKKKEKAKSD